MAPFRPAPAHGHLLDFRPVLRNRPAMGYVLGYGAHCFELYGMRTWIVAFWTYVVARNGDTALLVADHRQRHRHGALAARQHPRQRGRDPFRPPSRHHRRDGRLRRGRAGDRFLRRRVAALLLVLVLIYAVTIPADSGALTSGMAPSADPANRGATMALHSTVGFGLSALGGWAGGVALDAFGGPASPTGWFAVFAVFAAGVLLGPLALWWSRRDA